MLRHQGERVDRAAAASEDVGRSRVERLDQLAHVLGVLVRRRPRRLAVGAAAAARSAGVVSHHGAIGELPGQGGEAGGIHWCPDEQQDGLVRVAAGPHVVVQHGPRRAEREGLWLADDDGSPFDESRPRWSAAQVTPDS